MKRSAASMLRRLGHQALRASLTLLPQRKRFALFRNLAHCEARPDERLVLKIADQQDELEACFRILHDSYVAAGFMRPDPSGMRVTIYHALPTTTTLCAKWDGQVVGTISIIREGVFGFPLQSVFDLAPVRARMGRVAEISALAISPAFRRTGGKLLFPLMKFMYEYCREYFDTRHILIAVNPNKIELYESLLFFERLQACVVDNYAFANGAPAVGASLDLMAAPEVYRQAYGERSDRKNLHRYFVQTRLPNIQWPKRRFFTTNDPVLTPAMMDHFFNQRTQVFASLDARQRMLLRSIYDDPAYAQVLPPMAEASGPSVSLRQHQRFSIRCPAQLWVNSYGTRLRYEMHVIELSLGGFQAECAVPLPEGTKGEVHISLGMHDAAKVEAVAVRRRQGAGVVYYGFAINQADEVWRQCVTVLRSGRIYTDLSPLADGQTSALLPAHSMPQTMQANVAGGIPAMAGVDWS